MLHLETVEPGTFSILEKLMALPEFRPFHLVGGTALSLLYGHRVSDDLGVFTEESIDLEPLNEVLREIFGVKFLVRNTTPFGTFCFIDSVKVDIIRFPHPIIRPTLQLDGIRLYAPEDIVAMKVQAVLGRGRKKDFWDVAELLKHFSVQDFIDLHKEKYKTQNLIITVPQALIYFDDAEESEDPISLQGQTWKSVKEFIQGKVREYLE